MCQDPKRSGILDSQDLGSKILEDLGPYAFVFSRVLRDFGSCHGNMTVVSWGSWISDRKDVVGFWGSWIQLWQGIMGSCRSWILHNNMPPYLKDPLHPISLCSWFPMSMLSLNLSTVNIFSHIWIQPFCVDLKTGSPCWSTHMLSIIEMLLTGCGGKERNAHLEE